MSLVTHKYTPAEMSDQELEATFAAREHTVDYLVNALRNQMHKGTLSSYVITGPRGAGKSTVIQMVDLRIRQDAELSAAWIPVIFPEEQFNMISLRDMLAATLQTLVKQNIPRAQEWLDKVEAEPNEEQSEQLAVTGLREITKQTGKRFVLFIENLDDLLEEHLDDKMKGTLRRLLMSDAFMMIVGSTVHIFDALKDYDEAFFNYFGQVPLNRLNAEQVSELLRKRAEYDQNERFLRELPKQQAKVRTLVHLTGGNPRFVLMLYELLSLQQITTIVQYLRKLVDELTPLLKDEMENLPPQQRKIIHALMERGGTAQPTDLTGATRLPLNAINTQLRRLKDAQIVEVLGGGKGRAANYTVPDKLFSIWYQMRYLSQNRRRIEVFVEVLRVWFEEEERLQTLRQLAERAENGFPHVLRECATDIEYFAASLKGTPHEQLARDLCVGSWVKTDLKEAAIAFADLSQSDASKNLFDEIGAHTGLASWLSTHGNPRRAIEVLDEVLRKTSPADTKHTVALIARGQAKLLLGDFASSISDFGTVVKNEILPPEITAIGRYGRALAEMQLGDIQKAIVDLNEFIKSGNAPADFIASAYIQRGDANCKLEDFQAGLVDYSAAINLKNVSEHITASALINRIVTRGRLGNFDFDSVDRDAQAVLRLKGASAEHTAMALFLGSSSKNRQGEIADLTKAVDMAELSSYGLAYILLRRAKVYLTEHKHTDATSDLLAILELNSPPEECLVSSTELALKIFLANKNNEGIERVLAKLCSALNLLERERARETSLRFLNNLATAEMKDVWPMIWRRLVAKLNAETAEAIQFFGPVSEVLEGKDLTLLDALPPEQREFALEVLAKFEPKGIVEPAKGPKTKTRKRASTSK